MSKRRAIKIAAAAAPAVADEFLIANAWGGEVQITAAAAPSTDGAAGAKLDVPDSQGGKTEPSPNGHKIGDNGGKAPLPKFALSAYNGGPMRIAGLNHPVVVNVAGTKFAAQPLPHYFAHPAADAPGSELMETLIGNGICACADGKISSSGVITGTSKTICSMVNHAAGGMKFQTSIHGRPVGEMGFIAAGNSETVNGQAVAGPCYVARQILLDHIAILPLGADTSTSAHIAAQNAAGDIDMEKNAWIKAHYGLDETAFKALPTEAQKTITAAFDASGKEPAKPPVTPPAAPPIAATGAVSTADAIKAQNDALAANMNRITGINAVDGASQFPAITAMAVSDNWSVEKAENVIIKAQRDKLTKDSTIQAGTTGASAIPKDGLQLSTRPAGRGGRHDRIAASARIGNELSAVIEACGLISAGYSAERLSKDSCYGVRTVEVAEQVMRKFGQGLGPVGLFRLAASYAGINLPQNKADPEFMAVIQAEFSTLSLPVILSNLMNKFLLDSYTAVDPDFAAAAGTSQVAWQQFVKRGPVQDFKPHYRVRLAGNLEMIGLGPTGEIQHGQVGEQSYKLTAQTRAIMFGISREQIINDDLSAMSTMPTLFGRGAGIAVAKAIYSVLIAGLQSDMSTAFFDSSASTTAGALRGPNLITSSGLAFTTLETAESMMMGQTDPYGLPFGGIPEVLLVPPGIKNLAMQLYTSTDLIPSIRGSTDAGSLRGAPAKNTLAGRFRPVCSTWLASLTAAQVKATLAQMGVNYTAGQLGSATTWYLACGPQQAAYPIEAGFLNGQEMPIVERDELQFDRLGIAFRGFTDFGVSLAEQRAVVKATA